MVNVRYKGFTNCVNPRSLRWGSGTRTKEKYGPNPKTFPVGPYIDIFRCDRLICRTIRSERIPTVRWHIVLPQKGNRHVNAFGTKKRSCA